jgi:hypothetical protein
MMDLSKCHSLYETYFECPPGVSDAVFGSELAEEVEKSRMEAPWPVIKCIEEIETWCLEHSKWLQ